MSEIKIDRNRLNDVMEAMCDKYCKFPFNTETQADLNKHCEDCPLNNILVDDYPLGRNDWQE